MKKQKVVGKPEHKYNIVVFLGELKILNLIYLENYF